MSVHIAFFVILHDVSRLESVCCCSHANPLATTDARIKSRVEVQPHVEEGVEEVFVIPLLISVFQRLVFKKCLCLLLLDFLTTLKDKSLSLIRASG